MARVAAVDLGASSGRVIAAEVTAERIVTTEAHRFPTGPVRLGGTLHWDVLGLYREIVAGLRAAGPLDSVGIDSWGVDYGLLDASGALLGNPVSYRDARTDGVADAVHARVDPAELYRLTGVQVLPFNTIYQLAAGAGTPQQEIARTLLMIPDLLGHWLSGARVAEITNASTTGLLDVGARDWARPLIERIGLDPALFPDLVDPGTTVGELTGAVLEDLGGDTPVSLVAVGSHDTASAVAGVPAAHDRFGYVSCGTWSLVGVELDAPVRTEAGRAANFANELGVDGTVRYLRNVMGLWLVQECLREWDRASDDDLAGLLDAAAAEPELAAVLDAGDPAFIPPGRMPERIAEACRASGQPVPVSRPAVLRVVLDSLALAHRRTIRQAVALSGKDVEVVHVVGGGSRNELLCQLTADACGLPVVAGPVEATALGNILVQARTLGALRGDLAAVRRVAASNTELRHHRPNRTRAATWDAAERRLFPGDGG